MRKKALPYHVHINLDIVEVVHFIVEMLIEVPNIVSESTKIKSRAFRNFIESFNVLYFNPKYI